MTEPWKDRIRMIVKWKMILHPLCHPLCMNRCESEMDKSTCRGFNLVSANEYAYLSVWDLTAKFSIAKESCEHASTFWTKSSLIEEAALTWQIWSAFATTSTWQRSKQMVSFLQREFSFCIDAICFKSYFFGNPNLCFQTICFMIIQPNWVNSVQYGSGRIRSSSSCAGYTGDANLPTCAEFPVDDIPRPCGFAMLRTGRCPCRCFGGFWWAIPQNIASRGQPSNSDEWIPGSYP